MVNYNSEEAVEYINNNASHTPDEDAIYIAPNKEIVRIINTNKTAGFKNKKTYKTDIGTVGFAKGMKVMTTSNNGSEYKNGSMGIIDRVNKKSIRVKFKDGHTANVRPLSNGNYPIALAYAITVHKAQGQTFDSINLVRNSGFFEEWQLYVALSRCRTISGVHLVDGGILIEDLKCNMEAVEFQYGDMLKCRELADEMER